MPEQTRLARGLWASDIFEARVAAGKLFLHARIHPDYTPAWCKIPCAWMRSRAGSITTKSRRYAAMLLVRVGKTYFLCAHIIKHSAEFTRGRLEIAQRPA
ncbi:MAG: hypothetical protein GDA52_09015 [Rhodobacteraceae bacterium]|nr:hypothetical protein [Paracoccaceae bacterium]